MSITRKYGSKVNIDYKARLEHKLYLARENPEPIFDVSECGLKNVPTGIYSLCKVFRKQALWMHTNILISLSGGGALSDLSLLVVLDLHDNKLTGLPPEIKCLVSLKEFYLQDNDIKKLPNEIVHLNNLSILDLSRNNLKQLPDEMGKLCNLTRLDISHNKCIQSLPKSLGYAQVLDHIKFEGLNLLYPPQRILKGGSVVIIEFLAKESGIEYPRTKETISDVDYLKDEVKSENLKTAYHYSNDNVQAMLQRLEKIKEQRQSTLLEAEKHLKQQREYEMNVQSLMKSHKKKLLEELASQQIQLEHELEKVQLERDVNRTRLLSHIYNAEKEADNVIQEFLRNSEEERQSQAKLIEQEKQDEMKLLSSCHAEQFQLRTKDTLFSMEELLEEELKNFRKLEEYTKCRDYTTQSLLILEVRNHEQLTEIMQNQEKNRQEIIERLRRDEVLQKAAVTALLERSDARSWSIMQQVNLVQQQLSALTNIELEKRKLEINQQINEIATKRTMLSTILVHLLELQETRRKELLETINHIEQQRNITPSRNNSLFWLMQYQSLMEARPQGLLEMLEPSLVRHVAIAGALHCLPFLVTLPSMMPNVTHEHLKHIGINNENDREAIMSAVENYLTEMKLNESREPSAPFESSPIRQVPSAPPAEASNSFINKERDDGVMCVQYPECVICLDLQCEMIFLPCGHMCCCSNCSLVVELNCPMCRSNVERRVRVVKP